MPFILKARPAGVGVGVGVGVAATGLGEGDVAELVPDPPHAAAVRATTAKATNLLIPVLTPQLCPKALPVQVT
jgi:hypothetical protein